MGIEKTKLALNNAEIWLGSAKSNIRDGQYSAAIYSLEMEVEISLKAALLSQGINVPKVHDISKLLVEYSNERRGLKLIKENQDFILDIYTDLLDYRNSAAYLFESEQPEIDFKDLASDYLPKAEKVLDICKKVVLE